MTPRPPKKGHGTYTYAKREKCTCQPCLDAKFQWRKRYEMDYITGHRRLLPAQPVREHVQELLDAGVGSIQICRAADVPRATYNDVMGGRHGQRPASEKVVPATAKKLLGVTFQAAIAEQGVESSVGITRRVQALGRMGHAPQTIAEHIGISKQGLYCYMESEKSWSKTIDKVDATYLELRDVEGTSRQTYWQSLREQWVPWMCWDDETIDDPDAQPSPVACAIDTCSRAAITRSLCRAHSDLGKRRFSGMTTTDQYRRAVTAMQGANVADRARVMSDISQLIEFGVTDSLHIAERLDLALTTVQKYLKDQRDGASS